MVFELTLVPRPQLLSSPEAFGAFVRSGDLTGFDWAFEGHPRAASVHASASPFGQARSELTRLLRLLTHLVLPGDLGASGLDWTRWFEAGLEELPVLGRLLPGGFPFHLVREQGTPFDVEHRWPDGSSLMYRVSVSDDDLAAIHRRSPYADNDGEWFRENCLSIMGLKASDCPQEFWRQELVPRFFAAAVRNRVHRLPSTASPRRDSIVLSDDVLGLA